MGIGAHFDVIVVGARCAGAATAMLLSRAGLRVLAVDRSRPGSDKLSTLYIHQPGVEYLRNWGLLDDVIATGCPPIDHLTYRVEDVVLRAPGPTVGGGNVGYAPRRYDLDAILVRGAQDAGAHVVHHASVIEAVRGQGRVSGVRYRHHGVTIDATADLVVGADGAHSTVAALVAAPEIVRHPKLSCCYYGYWQGLDRGFEQHQAEGLWVGVIPTTAAHIVACYFRQDEFPAIRVDSEKHYWRCVSRAAPDVGEELRQAQRMGRLIGMGDQQNFFRAAGGPGWALVGDAGHQKDSLTARGITDAFIQATLLADAIIAAGSLAPKQQPEIIDTFSRGRTNRLMPFYRSTLAVARLDISEERLAELRRISASPIELSRYGAVVAGAMTPEEFRAGEPTSVDVAVPVPHA